MSDMQRGRQLPHNLEAERGLLGAIMVRNDSLFEVVEHVTKADFFEPAHGELFTLMRDMIEAQRTAIPSTIMHDYSQDADIGGIKASAYLAKLFADAPHPSVSFNMAKAIADLALKRRLIGAAETMIKEVWSAPVSLSGIELRTRYDVTFEGLFSSTGDLGIRKIGEVGNSVLKGLANAMQKGTAVGIFAGPAGLRNLIGAFMPGRVYSLFGSPGAGKSRLAQQIAEDASGAAGGFRNVLMFSLEMKAEELAERGFASDTGVKTAAIESGMIDDEDFTLVHDSNERRQPLNFYVDDKSGQSIGNIRSKCIRQKRLVGLDIVIIDNLMYLKRNPKLGEFDGIRENMQEVKRLAKDLDVPVILIGHLKKEYADGPIRPPTSGDIYGGGAPEQESDVVMFAYREEYMLRRRRPPEGSPEVEAWKARLEMISGTAQLSIEKFRGGEGNKAVSLWFDGAAAGFIDQPVRRKLTAAEADLLSFTDSR